MALTEETVPTPVTDEYLRNNEAYARTFTGPLPFPPARHTAVVACMDARLDVYRILGLHEGDSHVVRNAGGGVTDDAIRSLVISQRLLGTVEIIVIHHTDCGMLTFTDDALRAGIARIKAEPHLLQRSVRGFIFDVATGRLSEVQLGKQTQPTVPSNLGRSECFGRSYTILARCSRR